MSESAAWEVGVWRRLKSPPDGLTRDELLAYLKDISDSADCEDRHQKADEALLAYINDPEIRAVFDAMDKWYA